MLIFQKTEKFLCKMIFDEILLWNSNVAGEFVPAGALFVFGILLLLPKCVNAYSIHPNWFSSPLNKVSPRADRSFIFSPVAPLVLWCVIAEIDWDMSFKCSQTNLRDLEQILVRKFQYWLYSHHRIWFWNMQRYLQRINKYNNKTKSEINQLKANCCYDWLAACYAET